MNGSHYVSAKLNYLDFTQAFWIFDTDFWNTFYDESRSHANRTINPKKVIPHKQMNFTVTTPLIWTTYPMVHGFLSFRYGEDPVNGIRLWFAWIFRDRLPILAK
jgi:hypothetical protein